MPTSFKASSLVIVERRRILDSRGSVVSSGGWVSNYGAAAAAAKQAVDCEANAVFRCHAEDKGSTPCSDLCTGGILQELSPAWIYPASTQAFRYISHSHDAGMSARNPARISAYGRQRVSTSRRPDSCTTENLIVSNSNQVVSMLRVTDTVQAHVIAAVLSQKCTARSYSNAN
jgi:hypothetical protein